MKQQINWQSKIEVNIKINKSSKDDSQERHYDFQKQFIICYQLMKLQYYHFIAQLNLMSIFLLPQTQFSRTITKQYRIQTCKAWQQVQSQLTQNLQLNLDVQAKKLGECAVYFTRQTQELKQLRTIFGVTDPNHKNVITIQFNKRTRHIRFQMTLLSPDESYFQVRNICSIPQLAIKVNNYQNLQNISFARISFGMSTGQFRMQFPLYTNLQRFVSKKHSLVQHIAKNYTETNSSLLKFIVNQSNSQKQPAINANGICLEQAQRFLDITHIRTLITQSTSISEQEIMEMKQIRKKDFENTYKNCIKINDSFRKLNQLYQYRYLPSGGRNPHWHFELNQDEERIISNKITPPLQQKPKSPAENLMVLNYIYVCDLPCLRLKKIDEGGFSSIFLTQIKYVCSYPTAGYDHFRFNINQIHNHKNLLQKCVILKKQDEDCGYSRNHHEMEIIKKIKEPSVFLPKYYIIQNKPNPYSNAVVMDYIQFQNLNEYMRSNMQSMSLRTKFYLIYAIIQALRFMRDHHIVHLDLKPNNIMLYYNLIVKLIDFGESYQHQVCSKKHKPGFSLPYSSPEIFSNQTRQFTTKSDVFSLGVIMFEMLYRCYPYDIFEDTELIDDIMSSSYLKKWLFAPEQFQKYGDIKVLRIMNSCISRCLSPVGDQRPQLDWLAIIVRYCIQYLH